MSFGFGVGDILAVSKLALGIWGRVRDSSDQFKAIRGEAAGLKIVLDDLAEQVSNGQLSPQQIQQLSTLVEGCRKVLEDIDAKVKKYDSLDTHASGPGAKTEKVWKKLKWDQSEIDALRLRIISNITSLEAFNAGIASASTHATNQKIDILDDRVKSLHLDIEHKDRQATLDWLSSTNFPAHQIALSSGRQEGTGSWLIESEEFQTWTETGGKTLICQGIPGAGKTMLASLAIDHLSETFRTRRSCVIYIYCDYRMQQQQTLSSLIASLLKQSLQQQQVVTADVTEACQGHIRAGTRPKVQEMLEMLQTAMASFSRIYVIVDALDELSSQDQGRQNLLEELRSLQVAQGCNLLITSRHITNLALEFREPLCLEIRASPEDVRKYVCGHMTQLPNCVRTNMGLQESIASSIVAAVDGMFLLAQLHLDSLKDQASPKAIKRTLMDLPKGFKGLGQAYKGAMQRIDDQLEGFRFLAKQVLGWLTYAKRLMSMTELQHAIAIELGEREFDKDNLVDPGELVSVCAGLVVVDDQSKAVRLVHYTTQEYFEQYGESLLPGARQTIAESCLTYLLYDDFATGWLHNKDNELDSFFDVFEDDDGNKSRIFRYRKPSEAVKTRLRDYPFYKYAAKYWATHATDGLQYNVENLLLKLVRDDTKVSSAAQVLMLLDSEYDMAIGRVRDGSRSSKPISAMRLLSYLGADKLISILLDQGFGADTKDLNNAPALWLAVYNGDVETQTRETHLSQTVEKGHGRVVELLLARRDIEADTKDFNGSTSLHLASYYGLKDMVRRLLDRDDVDVNMVTESGMTALSLAVAAGNADTAAMLSTHADTNINSVDKLGRTPFIFAALSGQSAMVELLLSHDGVNVNIEDCRGRTALLEAATQGNEDVLMLLLAHATIDLDIEDDRGRNVLTQVKDEQEDYLKRYGEQNKTLELLRATLAERSPRK